METRYLKFENSDYIVRFPKGYKAGKKYPVVLVLHGAGSRGRDIEKLLTNPAFKHTEGYQNELSFILVAPQCYANTWFDIFEELKRFAVSVAGADFTDRERLYLMGVSMGGYGAWQLAMSLPELFAAIVPMCGGGMYWNSGRLVNVPVWAFHGEKDKVVFPEESQKMVDGVNIRGGNARLTLYPENGHNAWDDTYSNKEVFEWMLSHKNSNEKAIEDIYKESNLFG